MVKQSELGILSVMEEMGNIRGIPIKEILKFTQNQNPDIKISHVLSVLKKGMRHGYIQEDRGRYKFAAPTEECPKPSKRKPRCSKKPCCPKSKPCCPKPRPNCPKPRPCCPKPKPCCPPAPCSPRPCPPKPACRKPRKPCCPKPKPCCPKPRSPAPSEENEDSMNSMPFVPRTSMKRDVVLPSLQFPPTGVTPRQFTSGGTSPMAL